MRVYLRPHTSWPGGFPTGLVARTPTSTELIDMARRLPFNSMKKITRLVPCMLDGVPWSPIRRKLDQYTHLRDPYDYYMYCMRMSQTHAPKSRKWLPSVARLLICWMAEEMRTTHGVGNGFEDHFKIGALRNHEEPFVTAEDTEEEEEETVRVDLSDILEYYDAEMRELSSHGDHGEEETANQCASRAFPSPPNQNAQRARTLGNNENLKEYLRTHAASNNKRVRGGAGGYLDYSNKTLYKYVKRYLLDTEEGRNLLVACEVDAQSVTIDHVWPECRGGPDHLFNYHVMPTRDNATFNDTPHTSQEKQAYVGRDQMALLNRLLIEGKTQLPWHNIG